MSSRQLYSIAQATISRWHNGAVIERLDYGPVSKLMEFFKCSFGELVSVDTGIESEEQTQN